MHKMCVAEHSFVELNLYANEMKVSISILFEDKIVHPHNVVSTMILIPHSSS